MIFLQTKYIMGKVTNKNIEELKKIAGFTIVYNRLGAVGFKALMELHYQKIVDAKYIKE